MKVSRNWLQSHFDAQLPTAAELGDALTFHVFEIDGIEHVNGDDILDVKVTANRGHDCLSHRGIAKELSAILELPMKSDPFRADPMLEPKSDAVRVTVTDTKLCPRFTTALIKGVKVGPSPEWLRAALESLGQRSINNVVDATNYVMFDLGQPLHAFDAGKLAASDGSYALSVRSARIGEKMLGLDDKEYALTPDMLVIADGNAGDTAVSIAGIKGGKPTGIDEATTAVILEAANWNGAAIRKTSQSLKLRTDASSRFEQVISPELASYGLKAAADLIVKIAGGEVAGFGDVYPLPAANVPVSISTSRINAVLGSKLANDDVAGAFKRLDLPFSLAGETFAVIPPFERLDLIIPEDLIEEVGRIIGYDKIPNATLPPPAKPPEVNQNFYAAEKVRHELMSEGYSEVFTSAFAEKGDRVVANKADGVRPFLRSNLTDGLAEALKKNIPNKDLLGLKTVRLFEIGTIWHKDGEEVVVGTIAEKEPAKQMPIAPVAAASYDVLALSAATRYRSFSRYPSVSRDIALWVPAGTEADDVLSLIRENAGELLVKDGLFDRFEKAERVSLAFRLVFQSFEKTLTDIEVNAVMEQVSAALKAQGFEIR